MEAGQVVNGDEARIVCTTMQAMWPSHRWKPGEADRLVDHLLAHELADVIAAAGVLERTEEFFPHWSKMHDILTAMVRRRRDSAEKEPGGDAPADPERVKQHIADAHRIVGAMTNKSPLKEALERGWG